MKRMVAILLAAGLLCASPVPMRADASTADPYPVMASETEPEASTVPETDPGEEPAPAETAAEETADPAETAEENTAPEATAVPEETVAPTEAPAPAEMPAPTPAPTPTPALVYPAFTDVPEALEDAVAYVMNGQLMEETSPFTFSPELTLSRGNAMTVLYNLAGRPEAKMPAFPDVKGDWWYTEAIGWASSMGLISGYGDGRFGPKDPLTREQLACILYAYHKMDGHIMRGGDLSAYTDAKSVSSYAAAAVAWAMEMGVLQPTDSAIRPKDYATRGDMAQAVLALTRQENLTFTYAKLLKTGDLLAGPGISYEAVEECSKYWHLFVVEETDDWLLVRSPDGVIGYVSKDDVELFQEDIALPVTEPAAAITPEEAAAKLQALQLVYLDGMYWNNPDGSVVFDPATNNMDALVTDTPCTHKTAQTDLTTCAFHAGIGTVPLAYGEAPQCMGYASMLSDLIFGAGAPIRVHSSFGRVRVGDVIRLVSQSHSVVVTGIQDDGFVVTECNRDFKTCKIEWGRVLTWEELLDEDYIVITRYPDAESDGSSQILYAPAEVPLYAAPGDEATASTLVKGEFVYVIARQTDGWYLVIRESGQKGYVQADSMINLYRAA